MVPAAGERSIRVPFLVSGVFLVAGLALVSDAGVAEVPVQLLPDLRTRPPSSFSIDTRERPGTRLLRFSNEILNQGSGPMELGPKAEDCDDNGNPDDDRMAYQHVFRDTETIESPDVFLRKTKAGDPADLYDEMPTQTCSVFHPAHKHWHFEDFARYELRPMATSGPSETAIRSSDKVSFCLVDTNPIKPSLPGFSSERYYGVGPVQCDKDEITGISVGWADLYSASLADQWIDIGRKGGTVKNGTYCMISTVDPSNHLLEAKESNNSRSIRLKIEGNNVRIAQRRSCSRVTASSTTP